MKAAIAAVGSFVLGLVLLVMPMMGSTSTAAACTPTGGPPLSVLDGAIAAWGPYSADQMTNAATIVKIGAEKNIPARGQQIALMTAIEESGLIPKQQSGMDASDPRTAWGIFQQTPAQGWGTRDQVMDVEYATNAFYEALLKVPSWQSMTPATLAAHAVQGNADPNTYQASWVPAGELLAHLTGSTQPGTVSASSAAPGSALRGAAPRAAAPAAASSAGRSGTGTVLGEMPTDIQATATGPVTGNVVVANANIKLPSGAAPGLAALTAPRPDFITLNEVGDVPSGLLSSSAPGYGLYRDPVTDPSADGGVRSMDNALMWRADTWSLLDGGRVKIVTENHVIFGGQNRNWGQWATWGVFARTDGAVVSVIATHHMTNPFRFPNQQWGDQPFTRAEQYGDGMDHLIQLAGTLKAYGPVIVGGDMNSHPDEGPLAAAPKMTAAGYQYTKDAGVMYNFYAAPMSVNRTWEISKTAVHSDHPALFTDMAFNGAEPGAVVVYCDAAVTDVGGAGFALNAAATSVGPFTQAELIARAKEFAAGGPGWYRRCQNFVAQLAGRPVSGYESAASAMALFQDSGVFHSANGIDGYAPPVGAWLYYSNAGNPYGHVVTYLGNGQVAGTDTLRTDYVDIVAASDITDGLWHLTYEGWAVPWATPATDVAVQPPLPQAVTTSTASKGS